MTRMLEGDVSEADFTEVEGQSEDITEMEKTIDEELNSIFSEFGGDDRDTTFKIKVSRVMKDQGQEEICFYCLPQELPIFDRVKNEYGPGMYKITVYRNNLVFRRRRLNIAKPATPTIVQATKNDSQDLAAVLSAMSEMQQKQMEQFQSMLLATTRQQPVAGPASNPVDMMTAMVTALSQLNGIMPKPPENNNMEMLFKGMELMKDMAGDGGREKGLYDLLSEAAKTFGGPILEMSKMAATMPSANPAAIPGANPTSAPTPAPTVTYAPRPVQEGAVMYPEHPRHSQLSQPAPADQTQENDVMFMLKMQLANLVKHAARHADPALYADLIVDNMPEAQIRQFLGQPDLRTFLVGINPDVNKYWNWFAMLQREVMAALGDPTQEGSPGIDGQEILTNTGEGANTSSIDPVTPMETPNAVEPESTDSHPATDQ